MRTLLLKLALLSSFFICPEVRAEDFVDIDVNTSITPSSALGLIISETGTTQRGGEEISWQRTTPGNLVVRVPVTNSERAKGAIVTAMVMDKDGAVAFGSNKSARLQELSPAIFSLPACPRRKAPANIDTQGALVQSLMDVRAARRGNLQRRATTALQGELLNKLVRLERGFGLARAEPLDGSLHPIELEDRLGRLLQAVTNYRSKREAGEPRR
jgi:hypothetical protein